MSHSYRPVLWNKNKYLYDAVMVLAVTAYILIFLKIANFFLSLIHIDFGSRKRLLVRRLKARVLKLNYYMLLLLLLLPSFV